MSEKKFNREWVKTFAIIFLAVLLVLTFFSNTIMNMSLPEVSTQYIQYGSIKTQVRGSGTVLSQDNYSVTFPATREVSKVAVRQGAEVQKGDVLFYLAEGESKELESAREAYDNLNYEYTKMLINSGSGSYTDINYEIEQLREDLIKAKDRLARVREIETETEKAKQQVRDAEKAVEIKQNEIAELEREMAAIGYTPTADEVLTGRADSVTYEQYASVTAQLDAASEKLDKAEKELTSAKVKYETLQREYNEITKQIETPLETLEEQILTSDRNIAALERNLKYVKQEFNETTDDGDLEMLYEAYDRKRKVYVKAKEEYQSIKDNPASTEEEIRKAEAKYRKTMEDMDDAYEAYDNAVTSEENERLPIERELLEKETELKYAQEDNEKLKSKLETTRALDAQAKAKKAELDVAEKAYNVAQNVYDNADAEYKITEKDIEKTRNGYKYFKVKEYETKIFAEEDKLDELQDALEEAKEILSELQEDGADSEETLREKIKNYEKQLRELENNTDGRLESLELEKMRKQLEKAKEEVLKLEEKYTANEILAPVSGVIDSINIASGQKITPDASLAEISLEENGFRLTMTATQEQAAKLRPGATAEITSYIPYDSKVTATLTSIKNDTANPGSRQKILEFTIDGDVTPGQTLSLAVGDKNASYESTVPNTAIREDSDGKYILIVESKSTPISTRYIAKRVNVTVTASDDTRSAISGEFDSYAYVIATSSKPISDGEQVKLVEN